MTSNADIIDFDFQLRIQIERKGHVPDLAINQVKGNKPGRSGRITKYGEAYL